MVDGPKVTEFRGGWHVVLAAAFGSGLGVSGLLTYNSGLFVPALAQDFGLTRGQFGAVFFGATVAMALALPWCGRLVDRRGPLMPTLVGSLMLGLGFTALALLAHSTVTYAIIMVAIGLLAVGSTPVAYTRAVSARFEAGRGLALGLTQVGIGVSAALLPPLVGFVIARHGWPYGFAMLAGAAFLGALPLLFVFRREESSADAEMPLDPAEFAEVARSRTFRLQLAAVVVMAVGFAGLLPHFVPMLVDSGVSPAAASAMAGLIGVAVIVSRLIVGWLADIVHAPALAAGACGLCGAGLLLLALGGPSMAPVAALALGCAMGAEADLVGYLTARYFGIRVYGRAYSIQYAAFIVAAGVGPLWVGYLADWTGSYQAACFTAAGIMVVAIILFLSLPSTMGARQSPAA